VRSTIAKKSFLLPSLPVAFIRTLLLGFAIVFSSCESNEEQQALLSQAQEAGIAPEDILKGNVSGSVNRLMQGPTSSYCPDCSENRDQPAANNFRAGDERQLLENFRRLGGDPVAFQQAMCFLRTHGNKRFHTTADGYRGISIENQRYVTINDLTKPSTARRLFILDRQTGEVKAYHSGHGSGTGRQTNSRERITHFSNQNGSNTNPSGFFITGNTYRSSRAWGLGIRMHGLQQGINDNAMARGIVIHQADYTPAGVASSRDANPVLSGGSSGRSNGCTTVNPRHFREVERILSSGQEGNSHRGGSLYYNFSPTEKNRGANYCGHSLVREVR
jgi:hypothetical protein